MFIPSFLISLAMASLIFAQNIATVQVGGDGGVPIFTPNMVSAPNGTIVMFQFSGVPGNHTVTQSSLASPCEPLPDGFDSGFVTVTDSFSAVWSLTITNDQIPIWFYCKQLGPVTGKPHCEQGMVGVINLGTANFASFSANAAAATGVGGQTAGRILTGLNAFATAAPQIAPPVTAPTDSASTPASTASDLNSDSPTSSTSSGSGSQTTTSPPNSANGVGNLASFSLGIASLVTMMFLW
ncbi:hypothetical protein MVEN_02384200 [Mycena venus]|uniref:Extracellular serine-rich protein n=1 Tax=Mycena venus TaxID=2733690 RepID=A0A8H6X349_9AGAR|nr:hypothetical protein MVEN_02384200 [Mycena venus]